MQRTIISRVLLNIITKRRTVSGGFSKRNLYVTAAFAKNCLILERSGNCSSWNVLSRKDFRNSFKHVSSDAGLPPYHKVRLPALSPTMEKGTIVSWEKKERDKLNEGDLLAEIETDKATMGFETPEEGYLAKILVPAGAKDVPLGRLLCIIVSNEEDIASFSNYIDSGESETVKSTAPVPPKGQINESPSPPSMSTPMFYSDSQTISHFQTDTGKYFASPIAKKLAAEKGIDLSAVKGSGPGGRIRMKDIESYQPSEFQKSVELSSSYSDISLTSMRKVISNRLMQSKQTIPHYYLSMSINMRKVSEFRRKLNEILSKEGVKLSLNDFVIKATALACKKVPESNSSWREDFIRQYNKVDINFAVATDAGLITPIISDADKKGLSTISQETKALALKAKEGKLRPEEFQGGTFTVSNLGMFGVKNFAAIINPPQACILAVGAVEEIYNPDSKNDGVLPVINVTLSCDHRVIDGAVGAQWLIHFKQLLETPESMLL